MPDALRAGAPVVTVVVPAHNAAAYLGETLESLRCQTLSDIEVIVVDDGSSDGTASIAQSYVDADSRFRLIRKHVPSGRPACGRNAGVRAARSEYVALLDSDDVAVPDRLERSLAALVATGASVAFGDFQKFSQSDGSPFPSSHLRGQQFLERAAPYLEPADGAGVYRCRPNFVAFMLTDMPAVSTQTFFARRADLLDVGTFDESLVGGEDLDVFFRMAARYPMAYVDAVQTLMRVHSQSLTATRTDRCVMDAIDVRRAHVDALNARMTPGERRRAREAVAGMLEDLAYGRWVNGARASARAALLDSWRIRPRWRVVRAYLKAWLPREPLLRLRSRITGATA